MSSGQESRPVLVGICGGSGSGKTTVTRSIIDRVGETRIAVVPHDAYYKDFADIPTSEVAGRNFDHPEALDTDLLVHDLVDLKAGRPACIPLYDFKTHRRTNETRRIEPRGVILVDGILIFAEKSLRHLFDIKIFVDADADLRLIRRLRRDVTERGRTYESVLAQYELTVRPMHLEFVEPSKRWADLIVPEGGHNSVALDLVAARITELLRT